MGSDMPQILCNFVNQDGTPCKNPINPGSTHCSAGHPTRVISSNLSSLSTYSSVQAERFDMEDLISGPGRPAHSGPAMTVVARQRVAAATYDYPNSMSPRVGVLDGGIDQEGSPYLAFMTHETGDVVFLVERMNDDGEQEPQFYIHDSGVTINPTDDSAEGRKNILREVNNIRDVDEAATPELLVGAGFLRDNPDWLDLAEFRWNTLYSFRDELLEASQG